MFKICAILCLVIAVVGQSAAAAAVPVAASTPVRRCDNKKPLPLLVQLDDCTALPCNVWLGGTANFRIHFVAPKNDMSALHANVKVSALGIAMPNALSEERGNVCGNLLFGAYCPLDAGEDVVYHLPLQVSSHQPEVPSKIEVNLLDRSDNSVVACFVTDLRVKKGKQT